LRLVIGQGGRYIKAMIDDNEYGLKLEIMTVRVPEGTMDRINNLLRGGELRSVFIRTAVEAELTRREKKLTQQRKRQSSLAA
jgi:metal-responsive CopG/Arc/MetJ family transcriptional regulator